jgi:hypothetical protein
MARSRLWFALSSAALVLPAAPAYAGAWTENAGEGKLITTVRTASADEAFDGGGQANLPSDFQKSDVEAYLQHGLTDSTMLVVQTSYVRLRNGGARVTGWDDTQIGVQQRLLERGGQALSVSASAFVPGRSALTSGGVDGEVRVLYGRSLEIGGKAAFFDLQTGYRWRANGFADQIRSDLTFGWSATPDLMLLAQSFNIVTTGGGANDYDGEQGKAQASAVWKASPAASVQLGAFATLAGANAARERGLFASLWLDF